MILHIFLSLLSLARWSHLPPISIETTTSAEVVTSWLSQHVKKDKGGISFLGLDTETVPGGQGYAPSASIHPATLQISTGSFSLIYQLANAQGAVPSTLVSVLRDPSVLCVGVAIDEDARSLYNLDPRLTVEGRLDLGGIAGSAKAVVGLGNATEAVLGKGLPKSKKLMLSDWSRVKLSEEQCEYAARDAWAAAEVIKELRRKFPAQFSDAAMADIVSKQMNVAELARRFEARKEARMRIKEGGMKYMSEEARPYREILDANRPPKVPVWEGLAIEFPVKVERKGGGGGGRWKGEVEVGRRGGGGGGRKGEGVKQGGKKGGWQKKGRPRVTEDGGKREVVQAKEMDQAEIDVIMKAIEEAYE
ncbi:hypothetical protein TrCOL_g10577 [Triparma columacea]|uniref:3'-5' exonuclease domain-containing protein n=1 Tax=Triparma columacea TaxID=722753 RepID=A0A9W7LA32_9STRA|nr:hypothetical protein TrCOL_g10577 [Triparma columacea]